MKVRGLFIHQSAWGMPWEIGFNGKPLHETHKASMGKSGANRLLFTAVPLISLHTINVDPPVRG